ncbi:MAG: TRAP transporter large permease [Rhodobacteraceae bacterium]|nr:MAG: TRAP transporter large permease [Paracoccaceae bacterium]
MSLAMYVVIVVVLGASLFGLPLGYSFIAGSVIYLLMVGADPGSVATVIGSSFQMSYVLLAVPMFIFTAQVMNNSTISARIFEFAHAVTGRFKGGLAQVDVVTSLIFSGISGSALADASGMGLLVTKAQVDAGYSRGFATAVTIASSMLGPLVPPSIIMLFYAALTQSNVGALFAAGLVAGPFLAVLLIAGIGVIAVRRDFPAPGWVGWTALLAAALRAVPAGMTVVVLLGGIYGGWFTPTEAAAVAAFYALCLSVFAYRSLNPQQFWDTLRETARQTSAIGAVLAGSYAIGHVIARERLGYQVTDMLNGLDAGPTQLMFIIVGIILVLGLFLDGLPIMLVVIPLVIPGLEAVGVDLVHFGIVATFALMIGMATPPVGILLLVMQRLTGASTREIVVELWPFLLIIIAGMCVLVAFPGIVMWLPHLLGY